MFGCALLKAVMNACASSCSVQVYQVTCPSLLAAGTILFLKSCSSAGYIAFSSAVGKPVDTCVAAGVVFAAGELLELPLLPALLEPQPAASSAAVSAIATSGRMPRRIVSLRTLRPPEPRHHRVPRREAPPAG